MEKNMWFIGFTEVHSVIERIYYCGAVFFEKARKLTVYVLHIMRYFNSQDFNLKRLN